MKIILLNSYFYLFTFYTISCQVLNLKSNETFCYTICDEVGGTCHGDQICQCKDAYTTLPEEKNHKLCNYAKKSKILFTVLELFIGFGVGHLYAERKVNGALKLIIYLLLCCISCCAVGLGIKFEQERVQGAPESSAVKFFFFIYAIILNIILTWQLFDFLMIMFGFYSDGNDIPLY
jgi:TM2 domain-containing membrane protein YozV